MAATRSCTLRAMSAPAHDEQARTIGLHQATGVGVGAIVGGGIFALAGVAFTSTGPATVLAFAFNGVIAFLTAMTFAEISSAFPESGGAYTFAKKILSVRSAFAAGWILWFAYIVAGVLYALGFAAFAAVAIQHTFHALDAVPPEWLGGRRTLLLLATIATLYYSVALVRSNDGGGNWATIGKVIVFLVLIIAGVVGLFGQPLSVTRASFSPFLTSGPSGLAMAMGFTFIALQGFDLVAAIAGEVKDPGHVIPKAMFRSLAWGLGIYIPLLLLVCAVGIAPGESIVSVAKANPETVIAIAAKRFLGTAGFWLVIVAAVLSTLSALQANLLAASRVAYSMARDRTLPSVLGDVHPTRKTPVLAIATTALTLSAIIFMVPDLASAGAAASLIFLLSFTLAHVTTYLARKRGGTTDAPYKTPWFPLVPVAGGLACLLMAIFQAIVVPDAAGILVIWVGLGVVLYWSIFAERAEIADATSSALDPRLVSLRGHSPLILVPIANPARTPALVSIANALAARGVGRILLLSVVPESESDDPEVVPAQLKDMQTIVYDALAQSYLTGHRPEALITSASKPMEEIRRIAEEHHCASLLIGMGEITAHTQSDFEMMLNGVHCEVAMLRSPVDWTASKVERILAPVGGRGSSHELRTRVLASLCRASPRELTFVSVLAPNASKEEVEEATSQLDKLSEMRIPGSIHKKLLRSEDAKAALLAEAGNHDLMLLGLKEVGWGKRVLGAFTLGLVSESPCATLLLSRRPARAYELLDPLRDDVFESIRGAVRTGSSVVRTGSSMVEYVPKRMIAGLSGRNHTGRTARDTAALMQDQAAEAASTEAAPETAEPETAAPETAASETAKIEAGSEPGAAATKANGKD